MTLIELKRWAACGLMAASAGGAFAEDGGTEWDAWTWRLQTEASVVLSTGTNPGDGLPGGENVLAEAALTVAGDRVLANGAEIGLRGTLRAQRDHPARPGFAGGFGAAGAPEAGLQSGLSATGAPLDVTARLRAETAYVYIDGGYGELTLGRDTGVAARFRETPPEVFFFARADAPLLDPSGLALSATADRVSGQSAKISYASPRWLGIRAGVSVTPDADEHGGLDRTLDPVAGDLDATYEVAANVSRRVGRDGPRLSGGVSYSHAARGGDRNVPFGGSVSTSTASALADFDTIAFGLAWLSSDDGFAQGDGYQALSASLRRDWADWSGSAAVSVAQQRGLDGFSARLGAGRAVGERIDLAIGWRYDEIESSGAGTARSHGPVIEITLRN